MNQDKGISIEIDSVYCPKCNDMHPTLMWHEKYDDYISETKYIESIVQACRKLGENICLDSARKNYGEYLQFLEIEEWEATGKCVVCSTRTRFKNIKTNNYVCSDGCRYVDNENIRCI